MAKENGSEPFDDLTPTIGIPIGCRTNRVLLSVLGDYRLEAQEHSKKLELLYDVIRTLPVPAPARWVADLQEELSRHHEKDGNNLTRLNDIISQ